MATAARQPTKRKEWKVAYKEKPFNIDAPLTRASTIRDRIFKVGVELEGWWDKLPSKDVAIVRDSSVRPTNDAGEYVEWNHALQGELPSPPLERTKIAQWVKVNHPQHVNWTCGMHVHMSFKAALSYSRLLVEAYPATVVEYMKRWADKQGFPQSHPIWARLADKPCMPGLDNYCRHIFDPDGQLKNARKDYDHHRVGNRYTAVNYCYNNDEKHTVEIRLLPMFSSAETANSAIEELLNITNCFLFSYTLKAGAKEKKIDASITIPAERVVREVRIEV